MIKTFITHKIFDTCISAFFNQLSNNFPTGLDTDNIEIGEYINVRIVVGSSQHILHGCRVESKEGDITILKYDGYSSPIMLITSNGELLDIKGSYDVMTEHFI